jgi:hypothetical protein
MLKQESNGLEEIKFIALPSARDIKRAGATEEQVRAYQAHQWRIRRAQEACAVAATQFLRPDDYRMHQQEYRMICEQARHKRNQALLAVFSETCTKGLS